MKNSKQLNQNYANNICEFGDVSNTKTFGVLKASLKSPKSRLAFSAFGAFAILFSANTALANSIRAEIVVDADTGTVLHEMNATEKRYPASITKVMTLYLLFEAIEDGRIKLDDKITYSKRASSQSPSKLGVKAGDSIDVETVILSLVTKSANDSAVAVAERVGGSEAGFAQLMTAKARQLGMNSTNFRNASGLPNPDQYTTAEDLAKLAIAIRRDFPRQYHWFGNEYMVYKGKRLNNHNHLVGKVDGVDGLKTGFINASGFNLAATATRNGKRIVTVVMGGTTWQERDLKVEKLIEASYDQLGVTRNAYNPSSNYNNMAYMSESDRADAEAILTDQPRYNSSNKYNYAQNTGRSVPVNLKETKFTVHVVDTSKDEPVKVPLNASDDEDSVSGNSVSGNTVFAQNKPVKNTTVSFAATNTATNLTTATSQKPVTVNFADLAPKENAKAASPKTMTFAEVQNNELRGKTTDRGENNLSAPAVAMAFNSNTNPNPSIGLDFIVPTVAQTSAMDSSDANKHAIMALAETSKSKDEIAIANIDYDAIAKRRAEAKAAEDALLADIERQERVEQEKREKRLAEQKAKEEKAKIELAKRESATKLAEQKAAQERQDAFKAEQSRQMALLNKRGSVTVQIGAFKSKDDANSALSKMATHFPNFAAKQVVSYQDDNGKSWFRARMTGLGIEAANIACKAVKSSGGVCAIVK